MSLYGKLITLKPNAVCEKSKANRYCVAGTFLYGAYFCYICGQLSSHKKKNQPRTFMIAVTAQVSIQQGGGARIKAGTHNTQLPYS